MPADKLQVREATVADATAIARVHVESSTEAYSPLAAQWSSPDLDERAQRWERFLTEAQAEPLRFDVVAELAGDVVGFAAAGPSRRDDVEAQVEMYVIHVLPDHRGKRIGGELWTAVCERARGAELRSMHVQTFAELRCCSFYEARGGEVAVQRPTTFKGGAVTEVVYLWPAGQPSE